LTDISPGASDQALAGSSSSDSPTGVIGIDLEFTDDLDWQANPLSYDFEHDLGLGGMSGGGIEIPVEPAHLPHISENILPQGSDVRGGYSKLSAYLANVWQSSEQGLQFLDSRFKGILDTVAGHGGRPPFVHARQWLESGKNDYLAAVESIAQLCANGTVRSHDFLLNAIKGELEKIQAQVSTRGYREKYPSNAV